MGSPDTKDKIRIGFLTTIEVRDRGFVGGLLVTNQLGRPLEFQCTTPVQPNRTQQILYGPTLKPFLISDLIGRTLVERAQVKPDLILVDDPAALDVRSRISTPVALCAESDADQEGDEAITLGSQRLQFHADFAADRRFVASRSQAVPESAELREPFERVREALEETLKSAA